MAQWNLRRSSAGARWQAARAGRRSLGGRWASGCLSVPPGLFACLGLASALTCPAAHPPTCHQQLGWTCCQITLATSCCRSYCRWCSSGWRTPTGARESRVRGRAGAGAGRGGVGSMGRWCAVRWPALQPSPPLQPAAPLTQPRSTHAPPACSHPGAGRGEPGLRHRAGPLPARDDGHADPHPGRRAPHGPLHQLLGAGTVRQVAAGASRHRAARRARQVGAWGLCGMRACCGAGLQPRWRCSGHRPHAAGPRPALPPLPAA